MKKNKILILIHKQFPRTKKIKFKENDDLIRNNILDSLEIMTLVSIIEKKFSFNLKKFSKDKKRKITIKTLTQFSKKLK